MGPAGLTSPAVLGELSRRLPPQVMRRVKWFLVGGSHRYESLVKPKIPVRDTSTDCRQ